jgi:acyl dehydratase
MRVFRSAAELMAAVGEHLGRSDWLEITQELVDQFAAATGDHQWIHVDRERAAAGPFGTTIAHGLLTLSVIPFLIAQVSVVGDTTMGLNYGLNRVRFPAPVPVGSRVRADVTLAAAQELPGGVQIVREVRVEREGGDKPVCVAETVSRYYW